MSVLLLRLAGPMQSWGTDSRFSHRDTRAEPSKSFTDVQVRTIDEEWVHRAWIGTYHMGSCCTRTWNVRNTRHGAEPLCKSLLRRCRTAFLKHLANVIQHAITACFIS